jgi:shikimate dehydrogenase
MTAIVTGSTQLLGVIGCPIKHSLSPVMHNAALAVLAQTSLPYIYVPLYIEAAHLKQAIQGLAYVGCRGFNVTIPHKQTIMPLLCDVSAAAKAVGAVNTVWCTEQGWAGTNTDIQGFLSPLMSQSRNWSQGTVTVLGSGGAARAVIAACYQLNCATIQVLGRDLAKLEQLQADFLAAVPSIEIDVYTWDLLPGLTAETALLVNTTPIGMYPKIHQSPLQADELMQLPNDAIVYDLIYTPNPTQLLQDARALGYYTIGGLEMLVQQGAAALEIWLGRPAPVQVMRTAVQSQLSE